MIKKLFLVPAATLLAVAGCGNQGIDASDAASVQPAQVAPSDLRAAVSDERVRRFYEARAWEAAWTRRASSALIEALGGAAAHGLDPADYLAAVEQSNRPAEREAALSLAALDYADALANGLVDPDRIRDIYTIPRPDPDLVAGLASALEGGDVGGWLAGLAPGDPEYRALSEAYLRYAGEVEGGGSQDIQSGDLIREGDRDPRVPRIVEALRGNGYLGEAPAAGDLYTVEIAAAVRRMQGDYGIAADGVVGPDTLEALNTGAAERARTLAVNLERRRWLQRRPPATRIDVNTAAARLDYWRDGQHRDARKVIVGQPGWETPQLGSPIFRLVANPTWTVPRSIQEEEIEPKGSGYMARNNMVWRDGWIVQQSGPDNALGEVKFDMRNDHAIYLHDTSAKNLFAENQRHFSHGCVRVEDALGFARMLAQADGKLAEFERAMTSGEETFVNLDANIPVRLLYHTAFVDQGGNIVFRTDPYGWDAEVAEALGYEARQARALRRHVSDVGP